MDGENRLGGDGLPHYKDRRRITEFLRKKPVEMQEDRMTSLRRLDPMTPRHSPFWTEKLIPRRASLPSW